MENQLLNTAMKQQVGVTAWQCRLCHEEAVFIHTRNPGAWQPPGNPHVISTLIRVWRQDRSFPHSGMISAPLITRG